MSVTKEKGGKKMEKERELARWAEEEELASLVDCIADAVGEYLAPRVEFRRRHKLATGAHYFYVETPGGDELILRVSTHGRVDILINPADPEEREEDKYPLEGWEEAARAFLALVAGKGCKIEEGEGEDED